MIQNGIRSIFHRNIYAHRSAVLHQSIRHYTKHECERTGFRRLLGPFWALSTPSLLQSYAVITLSFLLFLYPLDPYLYRLREVKAKLDAKVGS